MILFHGTPKGGFNIFQGKAIYFSPTFSDAITYAVGSPMSAQRTPKGHNGVPEVLTCEVSPKKIFDLKDGECKEDLKKIVDKYNQNFDRKKSVKEILETTLSYRSRFDKVPALPFPVIDTGIFIPFLLELGYDAAYIGESSFQSLAVFDPSVIKILERVEIDPETRQPKDSDSSFEEFLSKFSQLRIERRPPRRSKKLSEMVSRLRVLARRERKASEVIDLSQIIIWKDEPTLDDRIALSSALNRIKDLTQEKIDQQIDAFKDLDNYETERGRQHRKDQLNPQYLKWTATVYQGYWIFSECERFNQIDRWEDYWATSTGLAPLYTEEPPPINAIKSYI